MKYLFGEWSKIKTILQSKRILLFLDYDGTLTPIVNVPDKAFISKENKKLLKEISGRKNCTVAIITGRSAKNIKRLIGIKGIIYIGNHGLEVEGPGIRFKAPVSPQIKKIRYELKNQCSNIKGVIVEDKGLSLTIHYRLVNKKAIPLLKKNIVSYASLENIVIRKGKKVFEIRPDIKWDKGEVVQWFVERSPDFIPIYIGDDKTDEDAFKILKDRGLTIFVGRSNTSSAEYYLKNTGEVTEFLKQIYGTV